MIKWKVDLTALGKDPASYIFDSREKADAFINDVVKQGTGIKYSLSQVYEEVLVNVAKNM